MHGDHRRIYTRAGTGIARVKKKSRKKNFKKCFVVDFVTITMVNYCFHKYNNFNSPQFPDTFINTYTRAHKTTCRLVNKIKHLGGRILVKNEKDIEGLLDC